MFRDHRKEFVGSKWFGDEVRTTGFHGEEPGWLKGIGSQRNNDRIVIAALLHWEVLIHENEVRITLRPFLNRFPGVFGFGEGEARLAEDLFEKQPVGRLILGNENANFLLGGPRIHRCVEFWFRRGQCSVRFQPPLLGRNHRIRYERGRGFSKI